MANVKHTPGPWRITRAADLPNAIVAPDADLGSVGIAKVAILNDHEANARLIAAAPELLAALRSAERVLADHGYREWIGGSIADLRAAIAKAEAA